MSEVTFRELASLDELKLAEDVQRAGLGRNDDMPDNADLMLAIQHEGGLVAGAFRDARMLGFLFAFPSATPGMQHSHRLAVLAAGARAAAGGAAEMVSARMVPRARHHPRALDL
jgi:predicted GNAT superfamily acetyltransferase